MFVKGEDILLFVFLSGGDMVGVFVKFLGGCVVVFCLKYFLVSFVMCLWLNIFFFVFWILGFFWVMSEVRLGGGV